MKYPNWKGPENEGRVEALLNILGEPNAEAVLRDELEVRFSPRAPRTFFDANGRCIPFRGIQSRICDPDRDFHLIQPPLDYGLRLARLGEYLQAGGSMISAAEFEDRCQKLLELLSADEQCGEIVKAVHLPICIPQTAVVDYGVSLETFLPGVERSYKIEFPERTFSNYRKGDLVKKMTMVPGTRHDILVERLATGPVVGVYFPNPMQGFSVLAQREQIEVMPPWFLLSGGFDTATAMAAYPDVLARDLNTPKLDLAALQWRGSSCSLCFEASDDELVFGGRGGLGLASGYYSGGFFVLG